jgi:hypothetical protein
MTDNLNPKLAEALDQRSAWIEHAVAVEGRDGLPALQAVINELPAEHVRSVLLVALINRCEDRRNLRRFVDSAEAAKLT